MYRLVHGTKTFIIILMVLESILFLQMYIYRLWYNGINMNMECQDGYVVVMIKLMRSIVMITILIIVCFGL